ncbi:hypothetical protein XENTR_v10023316 [Xenopus tropicalis]|nr:hypothetical protein XENTR_v10023316 [Xenopus tropicalis]
MFRKGLLLSSDGEHFMDRNRAALVVRMSDTNIMLVMDELLSEKILNDVQYNTVRSNRASHEMMRKLYDYARAWGPNQKDTFISILSKYDKWLILDLMEKENQSLNSSAT